MDHQRRVIALGFFDGVHLGHAALLRRVSERAAALGAVPAAVTFDAHPETVILGQGAPLLTSPGERAGLMRRLYGIQDVIVTRFDRELMRMDWREFVTDLLLAQYGAVHLVAGHDFRFGYKGEGTPERLTALCRELGLGCDIIPPVALDGVTVSSTCIRTLIAQGETECAARFLGHPFALSDTVIHGKKLGSTLGFPTVNLRIPDGCVTPAFGVYAAQVTAEGRRYITAANIGVRPTVNDGGQVTAEGFLLDFDGDLYNKEVRMELYRHIRPEQKFESLEALRMQVMRDAAAVRSYFQQLSP